MSRPVLVNNIIKKLFPLLHYIVPLSKTKFADNFSRQFIFSKQDDMSILPPDSAIIINKTIPAPENIALPSEITEHFINESNHFRIMNTCLCREAMKCKDYPKDIGCLFLGEASTRINPAVARTVSRAGAKEHILRAKEAGLTQMIGRTLPDALWLNVKPHRKLFTICLCCPCCCVTRLVPYSNNALKSVVHPLPGTRITVNDNCTGCGLCAKQCYVSAISIIDDRAVITDKCMGCGRCIDKCKRKAIELVIERKDYFNEAVENLSSRVYLK